MSATKLAHTATTRSSGTAPRRWLIAIRVPLLLAALKRSKVCSSPTLQMVRQRALSGQRVPRLLRRLSLGVRPRYQVPRCHLRFGEVQNLRTSSQPRDRVAPRVGTGRGPDRRPSCRARCPIARSRCEGKQPTPQRARLRPGEVRELAVHRAERNARRCTTQIQSLAKPWWPRNVLKGRGTPLLDVLLHPLD